MITDPRKLPPMIPVLILIYSNFSFLFNYVLLETLTSTLAMDQWAWKPESAVSILMVDILIMVSSLLSTRWRTWVSSLWEPRLWECWCLL